MNDWIDGENDTSPHATTATTANIGTAESTSGYVAKPAARSTYPPTTTARAPYRSIRTPVTGLPTRPSSAAVVMIAPTRVTGIPVAWWKYSSDSGRYIPLPVASTTMPSR